VCWRVACATGRSLRKVARAPYHRTLYEFVQLLEQERIAGLLHRIQALNTASLNAIAWNEPKKLREQYEVIERDMGSLPTRDEALARGMETIEIMRQVDEQSRERTRR
jgi:hypothetical protein